MDAILITFAELVAMGNYTFMSQTSVDADGVYYMMWSCNGVHYKTVHSLKRSII
jgi:hypothetical protein